MGGAVVVIDGKGKLSQASARARDLLESYFGARDVVPGEVSAWLAGKSREDELVVDGRRGHLVVRLLRSPVLEPHRVLLLEEIRQRVPPAQALRGLGLTRREAEVLRLVAMGKENVEIGDELGISPATVRKHLERIYPKLGVNTRAAAATRALGA